MIPLRAQTGRRERAHRRLANPTDGQPPQLGLRVVLPISSKRQALWLEPQARVLHLPGVVAELANPTQKAPGAPKA